MEENGQVPGDISIFLHETLDKVELCKRSLEVPAKVLSSLREDVDTLSTGPSDSADSAGLSRKQRDFVHDINIVLLKDLQNVRSLVTQLSQHCQDIEDIILQVSMDVPTFLSEISLQHLDGNFSGVKTVQQLLNLNNIEGDMAPAHRRRLEREVGKIRARMDSGAGLIDVQPTLHRLMETTEHLTTCCLAKLKESVSVTTESEERSGITGLFYSLRDRWLGSSNSEDTFTTRHREMIEWIEQEQNDQPTLGVDTVTPDLTEFLLKNDLQTLLCFKTSIEKIRSNMSNVNSSAQESYKQAMEMADSL
ncbi:uncharacterized protein LOC144886185 [Branchiostoma floridae x Branchiostoma japonicum]